MFPPRLARAYLGADDRCRWRKRLFHLAHNSFTHPHSPPTSGGATSAITIQQGILALGNRACVPAELNVAVGASATWANNDSEGRTADSDASLELRSHPALRDVLRHIRNSRHVPLSLSIRPGRVGRVTVR